MAARAWRSGLHRPGVAALKIAAVGAVRSGARWDFLPRRPGAEDTDLSASPGACCAHRSRHRPWRSGSAGSLRPVPAPSGPVKGTPVPAKLAALPGVHAVRTVLSLCFCGGAAGAADRDAGDPADATGAQSLEPGAAAALAGSGLGRGWQDGSTAACTALGCDFSPTGHSCHASSATIVSDTSASAVRIKCLLRGWQEGCTRS